MKVESKYKNPDRYIERLKNELTCTQRIARENLERMGQTLFDYTDDTVLKLSTSSSRLGSFRAGDTVILLGCVKKITEEHDGSEIEYENVTVRRKESQ